MVFEIILNQGQISVNKSSNFITLNGHQINERVKLAKMKLRWNLIKFKINEINDGTLSSSYDLRSSNLTSDDPRWSQIVLKDQEQDHDDRQQLFNRLSFQLLAQLQLGCNWCDLWNDTSFIFSPLLKKLKASGIVPGTDYFVSIAIKIQELYICKKNVGKFYFHPENFKESFKYQIKISVIQTLNGPWVIWIYSGRWNSTFSISPGFLLDDNVPPWDETSSEFPWTNYSNFPAAWN